MNLLINFPSLFKNTRSKGGNDARDASKGYISLGVNVWQVDKISGNMRQCNDNEVLPSKELAW